MLRTETESGTPLVGWPPYPCVLRFVAVRRRAFIVSARFAGIRPLAVIPSMFATMIVPAQRLMIRRFIEQRVVFILRRNDVVDHVGRPTANDAQRVPRYEPIPVFMPSRIVSSFRRRACPRVVMLALNRFARRTVSLAFRHQHRTSMSSAWL